MINIMQISPKSVHIFCPAKENLSKKCTISKGAGTKMHKCLASLYVYNSITSLFYLIKKFYFNPLSLKIEK